MVFAALADVATYPIWQSDVLAAQVHGGGLARPGAEMSVVRKVLGRSEHFRMYVNECEQDRGLTLKTATDAWPHLTHAFRLKPTVSLDCCWLSLRVTLAGAPSLDEPLAEASLLYRVIDAFDGLRSYLASAGASDSRWDQCCRAQLARAVVESGGRRRSVGPRREVWLPTSR